MHQLPQRPDIDQLRRQARELQRRAAAGDRRSLDRVRAVSDRTTLSVAQLAVAREHGFPSWAALREEVRRRRHDLAAAQTRPAPAPAAVLSEVPPMRDWSAMRAWCREQLEGRTGESADAWMARVAEQEFDDESALREWLGSRGVVRYAQSYLVWERFGYPDALIDDAQALIERQYGDRPHLRPVLDAVITAAPRLGEVTVQARGTQVSLVGPRRTFAIVQATTRSRVDVALRLTGVTPSGGLRRTRGDEFTVRLELRAPEDLDQAAIEWLQRAYDVNAAPPPRRSVKPRPRVRATTTLRMAIEGSDLPGARCNQELDGHVRTNVHAALCTSVAPGGGPRVVPVGRRHVVGLVRGDAPRARWDFDVTLRRHETGFDVTGPYVSGPRGRRVVGLCWGDVTGDGVFVLFRGLGLHVADIDPALVEEAAQSGGRLVARLRLTDAKGNPRCASVRPPDVGWSLEAPPPA